MTRTPKFIDDATKWKLAAFLIEHRCVVVNGKEPVLWRVTREQSAREASKELGIQLTAYHMKVALDFYQMVCALTQHWPAIPPPDCSVEENRLAAELVRVNADNAALQTQVQALRDELASLRLSAASLADTMSAVRDLVRPYRTVRRDAVPAAQHANGNGARR